MFTDAANVAVIFAARLAVDLGASLTILHVMTMPNQMVGIVPGASVDEELQTTRAVAESHMVLVEAEVRAAGVERVETLIDVSSATADAIIGRAVSRACDLIVITTHGRGGVQRLILGSVADAVVRGASCPVLTVRPY
jgi:nucleotide-binding universal stress UspA family protein